MQNFLVVVGSTELLWPATEIIGHTLRPNKKIPVLRVTGPYLNLLAKPGIFSGLLEKIYNFMHFERHFTFQNGSNYLFFPEEKENIKKKKYLKFSDPLPKTHLFFYLALPFEVKQIKFNPFIKLYFVSFRIDHVISEIFSKSCYKGTILQTKYRKLTFCLL